MNIALEQTEEYINGQVSCVMESMVTSSYCGPASFLNNTLVSNYIIILPIFWSDALALIEVIIRNTQETVI